jgi:hypothetical protein
MPSLPRRTIGARCARPADGMFHGKVLTRVAMLLIARNALTANTAHAQTTQTSSQDQAERPSWGALDATGSGFLIGRTEFGEMTLSGCAVIRYIDQLPATQTFVDHLGNVNVIDPRDDIQFHKTFNAYAGVNTIGGSRTRFGVSSYRSRENRFNQTARSPVSSLFGVYVGGQKGTTLSSAFSIYF